MPVNLSIHDAVAVIEIDNPPVNATSQAVRQGLQDSFNKVAQDLAVEAIVVACKGRTFVAGADISEFGKPPVEPFLPDVYLLIEQSDKPVVAAVHGTALGGGFELALACHYRVALKGAKIGLPEVGLGLIPGAGGTQRLTRIAGVETALDLTLSAKPVGVEHASAEKIIDQLCDDDLLNTAIEFAKSKIGVAVEPASKQPVTEQEGLQEILEERRAWARKKYRGQTAPQKAIDAIEAAVLESIEDGLKKERELFLACKASSQSTALRHAFFAERQCAKLELSDKSIAPREVKEVAVIGAGTMGAGIAMCFASAGIKVFLVDVSDENLARGLQTITSQYEKSVASKRLTETQKASALACVSSTTSYQEIANVDLVVEAAFENMQVKKEIFKSLDEHCAAHTILASNTSFLDVNEIAAATQRPQQVLGLHFFSPAHIMKLLEIVNAENTSEETLLTTVTLAKKLRKLPCVVGVCYGFVGNRMYAAYGREFNQVLLEGATPSQVDSAMINWGMAMGPAAVTDLTGIDIGYKARRERPDPITDPLYFRVSDLMVENDRLGRKSGAGFYRYDEGKKQEEAVVTELIKQEAEKYGVAQRDFTEEEIQQRLIFALINEGAKILEEGIATRASDIDVVWMNGYGFPRWRGGPMCYADEVGVDTVYQQVLDYDNNSSGAYWSPSPLLKQLAEDKKSFLS